MKRPLKAAAAFTVERLEARQLLSTNVLSYHNDTESTGQNLTETTLTPANVNVNDFGKLYATAVDGQVYAQPLYDAGVNITAGANQGTHNVVYVATEHDTLYAIDADKGTVLWQDSFLVPEAALTSGGATVTVTTVPSTDVNSGNISPQIGITATPAIDPATGFLYLTAKTKQIVSVNGTTSAPHYVYTLYKVNIQDGTYTGTVIGDTIYSGGTYTFRTGSDPYVLDPGGAGAGVITVSGQKRVYFNAFRQLNRPGITLNNGNIYLAFGSHGDNLPYHGWILGYDENTLATTAVLNLNPNGSYDGVWQGGGRIDVDPQGFMYVETGNGSFDTTVNAQGFPINGDYGDSFVKIGPDPTSTATSQNTNGWGLKVVDYFTPFNQASLSSADEDLGSGGPMVLPDSVGNTTHPHLLVGAGKEGKIYLIDRDNMGKFSSTTDHDVQEIVNALPGGGSYGTPAFFFDGTTARIYYGGQNTNARTFTIANGAITATPDSKSTDSYGAHGSTPSISANGTSNGIVWDLEFNTGQLRAYNASSYAQELYTTAQSGGRDQLGGAVLFAVPTIADGQVYVGTSNGLVAYGEFTPPTSPPAAPTGLSATTVSNTQINLAWQDNANNEAGDYVEESTDGGNTWKQIATTGVGSSSYAVTGLQPVTTYYFRVRAFNILGDSAYSNSASATTSNLSPTLNFATGFASGATLLTLNGATTKVVGSNLQLTDGNNDETSSAYFNSAVPVDRFATAFTFQLTSATADGFTFTIQRAGLSAIGGGGGGLGYSGIPTSIAIKFDLYDNVGEGNDSTGLFINGDSPTVPSGAQPVEASIDMSSSSVDLHSGDVMQATLHYDGTTLQETVTDTVTHASFTHAYAIGIPGTIGGSTAYVGFTGATGGATAVQDILTWAYTPLPAPPATPSNLAVTVASGTELDVTWTESSSPVDSFTILRASGGGAFSQIAQVPGTTSMYADTALTQNSTYSYEVIATNAGGASAPAGPVTGTTPIAPAAPTNLQATSITTTGVTLTWQDNANNAIGYKITRQLASNESIPVATLGPTATSYTDNSLSPGSPYQYVVAAYNLAGPSMGEGVSFQTLAAAPSGLTATPGGQQVALSWTASTGATSYNIYRGTTPGGEAATPVATNVTGTAFTDTGLTVGQAYYYQVSAIDGQGEGPLAAEVSATPLLPGDADGDGNVGFADFTIVARHYGLTSGATWAVGDFNNDGSVGFDDLVILARNYGRSITPTTTTVSSAVQPSLASPALTADASSDLQNRRLSSQRLGRLRTVIA